jgi:hypothetical protein
LLARDMRRSLHSASRHCTRPHVPCHRADTSASNLMLSNSVAFRLGDPLRSTKWNCVISVPHRVWTPAIKGRNTDGPVGHSAVERTSFPI